MSSDFQSVVAPLDAAIQTNQLAEPAHYYHIQRNCLAAEATANAAQKLAFSVSAATAQRLAEALEPYQAIAAENQEYWLELALRLRAMIELGFSTLSAADIADRILAHQKFFETIRSPV